MSSIPGNYLPEADMAFFDLDETLTDEDTDSLWAAWRSRRSLRGWAERAWLAKLYRDYRRGGMNLDEYMRYQGFRARSMTPDEFRAMSRAFFGEAGRGHIYREAQELVTALKKRGCRTVMLTAQHDVIAGPFAEALGMDMMIANRFAEAGGRYTDPVSPYCIGEGKVVLGRRYAHGEGVTLDRCAFYGDSIYDAPFMELVGHPIAANPDRLLTERAERNNWPIVRFGVIERQVSPARINT
jgi:HAD superfamily hydrolase (TIGR01490 family)